MKACDCLLLDYDDQSSFPSLDTRLCATCGRKAGEHAEFVEMLENLKREEIFRVVAIELEDPDEIIQITPTMRMKRSEFESLRKIAIEIGNRKPSPPMSKSELQQSEFETFKRIALEIETRKQAEKEIKEQIARDFDEALRAKEQEVYTDIYLNGGGIMWE